MSGLGEYHHGEDAPTKSTKITHWVIFAVILAGLAAVVVGSGMFSEEVRQTAHSYPRAL